MSTGTSIEWTDATWNPIVGCSRVSPGCENCYAERFVHRGLHPSHRGLTVLRQKRPGWTGEVRLVADRLDAPQRWRKPRRVFVNSLSDLFHEKLTHEQRLAVFGAMCAAPQHIYQVLTKRPEVAVDFERWLVLEGEAQCCTFRELALGAYLDAVGSTEHVSMFERRIPTHGHAWWIGVTAEDQQRADKRIPHLLSLRLLPTLRFVSYEPALGPVDFGLALQPGGVDWIIVGGESGPGARDFDLGWARALLKQRQCSATQVFVKQLGACPVAVPRDRAGYMRTTASGDPWPAQRVVLKSRKGNDPSEWPEDLRVQEIPYQTERIDEAEAIELPSFDGEDMMPFEGEGAP